MRWGNRMQKQIFIGIKVKLFLSLCAFIDWRIFYALGLYIFCDFRGIKMKYSIISMAFTNTEFANAFQYRNNHTGVVLKAKADELFYNKCLHANFSNKDQNIISFVAGILCEQRRQHIVSNSY